MTTTCGLGVHITRCAELIILRTAKGLVVTDTRQKCAFRRVIGSDMKMRPSVHFLNFWDCYIVTDDLLYSLYTVVSVAWTHLATSLSFDTTTSPLAMDVIIGYPLA